MDLPGLGVKDALVVPIKDTKEFHQVDQVYLFSECYQNQKYLMLCMMFM